MISDPKKTLYVSVDGEKIPVWIYGDLNKYPIIYLHGFYNAFSQAIGDLPMRYLSKSYSVVAFDIPGYGESKNVKISRIDFINKVVSEILNNRKFTFMGLSYGGILSLRYSITFPEKIDGVIVVGSPFYTGIFNPLRLLKVIPKKSSSNLSRLLQDLYFLSVNVKRVDFPLLLIYSDSDKRATLKMGKRLNTIVKNSQLFELKNKSHGWLVHRINESGVLEKIEEFLKKFTQIE